MIAGPLSKKYFGTRWSPCHSGKGGLDGGRHSIPPFHPLEKTNNLVLNYIELVVFSN